ncbi:PREDICTED: uncharacterized protein LOC104818602 [Tarenaya hassleriana]|uniref:uncharacterized protein LOC104818602 n=1 Tax=Tarenaya hassleriana TaxID=28532 RepID=UPI00053C0C1F|nr:PREDICTED: uncharacterized protein LOC104818602 [Tarenaya hassleriana]
MGVAVVHPHDVLKGPFSTNTFGPHVKYARNPSACPNKPKKPQPNNRRRRSPPRPQAGIPAAAPPPPGTSAVVPKGLKKKTHHNNNHHLAAGQVRILKRGEEIAKTVMDLVVDDPDLGSTRWIGPDPEMTSTQILLSGSKSTPASFYAGPVTLTSPPPTDVPLPAFCSKKSVSMFKAKDATNDLIRILRLEI